MILVGTFSDMVGSYDRVIAARALLAVCTKELVTSCE